MTKSKTLTVRSPEDILALVPFVMGFVPEDSLVLLTHGEVGEPFHARVDLPEDPADLDLVIDPLVQAALGNGARRAIIVVYTDDHYLAEEAWEGLLVRLLEVGVETSFSLRADGHQYVVLDDSCLPPTAYDVDTHPFAAQAVFDGRVTYRNREALGDSLVTTDPEAVERVEAMCDASLDKMIAAARHPLGPADPQGLRAFLVAEGRWALERTTSALADDSLLEDEELARLLAALVSAEVRDVLWAEIRRLGARKHVTFWTDVLRRSPLDLAAPPAALLAFAAWMAGEGALAWCALDRCREADPGYTMASLVSSALQAAMPPGQWKGIDPGALTLFAG